MLSALLLASSSSAHVSLVPNYGAASGGYFQTSIKVPHGHSGVHTTKMTLHVPRGIVSIKPEQPAGWSVTTTTYELAEEDRYESHGSLVTTGPDKIIFTADSLDDALHNDHLMNIGLQLKLGCSFKDQVQDDYSGSNSVWQGQHTLWFKVDQFSSADDGLNHGDAGHSPWMGALKDDADNMSPSWNPPSDSGLKACPYLFIYAGSRCSLDHSGTSVTGGMEWMGAYVEPTKNMGAVQTEQHVITLATEAALDAQESLDGIYASGADLDDLKAQVAKLEPLQARLAKLEDDNNTLNIAVAALALAAAALGVISLLCVFRVSNKKQFAHSISGLPIVTNLPTLSATKEIDLGKA